ncbi:MAG TPA: hypothetical protein VI251_07835, partial [Pseudolabrys sp.]
EASRYLAGRVVQLISEDIINVIPMRAGAPRPPGFSGMSAFRLSTISSAAARFSSDAGASLVLANVSSLGKGCLMQKINR